MNNADKKVIFRYLLHCVIFVLGLGSGYLISFLSGVNPSYIPLVSAITGLLIAFSVPIWSALFVNAPKLSIEINVIKRAISDTAVISINDDQELRLLKPAGRDFTFDDNEDDMSLRRVRLPREENRGYTLSQTETLLHSAKQKLRELPSKIEERNFDSIDIN